VSEVLTACVLGGLFGLLSLLIFQLQAVAARHREDFKAWDIERGRYVAALLSQSRAGDLAASSVVRPRPPASDEPKKPVIHQEGM
jgi:hypothetical protein